MPVLSGPGCLVNASCPASPFPASLSSCICTYAKGGVSSLYAIECTEAMTDTNVLSVEWWGGLVTSAKLTSLGKMLGAIKKKSDKKDRISSCQTESIVNLTWAIEGTIKCIDLTSADNTTLQFNALLQNATKYLWVARMCDGDDRVLPIGYATVSDFDWVVPDNFEENQSLKFELSWIEFAKPKVYTVAGLSAVLPKEA